ncbi:MAG TPA: hypothetical protein VFU74_22055 [Actinocrinis sp.]|nr:hypothetical protein [Actinocrinis sp.]
MNGLAHVLGLDPGYWNMFWSGFGSCLGEFALLGGAATAYRHLTCHVNDPRFCWRPGIHRVAGTPFRACRKHHPAVPDRVSAVHLAEVHEQARAEQ